RAVDLRRATGSSGRDSEGELRAICRLVEVARARRYYAGALTLDVIDRAKQLAESLGRTNLVFDLLWVEWSAAATRCRLADGEVFSRMLLDMANEAGDPELVILALGAEAVHKWQRGRV